MSDSKVSAVIVVHDGERYLADAIESALAQQLQPAEVIVVDDGSTDQSLSIAQRFGAPVHCVSQAQRGIGGARNTGVALSSGDYVAFLDSDDLWTPSSLASLVAAFAAEPELELAFGHVRQFISPELEPAAAERVACRPGLEPGYLVGSALIRRGTLERVGRFHEDLSIGDFVDWIARARESEARETLVGDHVLWRRIHGSNHGIIHVDRRADYALILKRALDRRRAAARDQPR